MIVEATYTEQIEQWRQRVEGQLRAEDGWLTLAGLFWLNEGTNTIGSDPSSNIVLPAPAPARIGTLERRDGVITLHVERNVRVLVDGEPVTERQLRADEPGPADVVTIGDVSFLIIQRGERIGVRVRDRNSDVRRSFGGRHWFPVDESYRVTATFVPYDPPRTLPITNILGDTIDTPSPGYVTFTLHDQTLQLDATHAANNALFLSFRDQSSGRETYGAGRFLTTAPLHSNEVELDFNRAVSPPCAFTAFATCPLPSPQNHLPVRIVAGERHVSHES